MRIFFFLAVMLGISSVVSASITYVFYKIYRKRALIYLLPIFGFFPYIGMILSRMFNLPGMEWFNGHFFFYYNYVTFFSLGVILLHLILFFSKINILQWLNKHKSVFTGIFLTVILSLAFYGKYNFDKVKEEYYTLSLNENSTKTMRVGFISDIHLNNIFTGEHLDEALEKIQNSGAQLVLIGGDFLDHNPDVIPPGIDKIIGKYNFPKGIYTVLGNHEYISGVDKSVEYIKNVGVTLLRDEAIEIDGLHIIGRDDSTNRERLPLKNLLENSGVKNSEVLLIDHNPSSIPESVENNIGLQLSGHTHNGQLIPINYIVKYLNENGNGYKKIGNTQTLVSSGLGSWLIPYRIGSRSEYLILDIEY